MSIGWRHPLLRALGRAGRRIVLLLALFLAGGSLSSCRLILISEATEIELGAEAYEQALEGAKISTDPVLIGRVERIGRRLVQETDKANLPWEFKVVEDDNTINAFALPGGKVAVYTGIIRLSGPDDALLATVMGHEIAHVTMRHGAQRITQDIILNAGAAGVLVALENRDPDTVKAVMGALGVGTNLFLALPFSRSQESEADREGLFYMARAGYHPGKAIEFWTRMAQAAGGGGPPEFLSTHPSHETRIEDLERYQREALSQYKPLPPQ